MEWCRTTKTGFRLRPQGARLRAGGGGEEAVVLGLREGEGGGAPSEAEEEEVRRLRPEGPLL